jgi:predicted permease
MAPESLDRISLARVDLTVLAYSASVSLVWGLLFSLAPVAEILRTSRQSGTLLSNGTTRATSAAVRQRTRGTLLAVQVALGLVLLVSTGLLMRAFVRIQSIDPGFRADRRLTFRVALPGSRYPEGEALARADREIRRRLSTLPGVTGAGAISHLPYDDLPNWALTYAPAKPGADARAFPRANTRAVTPGVFEALGVELLHGRLFADDERGPAVIVDDLLAGRLWPGRSPLGERFFVGQATPEHSPTVIGVVRHLRLRSIVEDLTPQIFIPYQQWQRSPMAYIVHTEGDPLVLAPQVRAAMAAFDPRLPIYDLRPLGDYVAGASSIRRFTMLLAAAFAGTALALTCIGIYGVAAYGAASRRSELAIRRALGAPGAEVVRVSMSEGMRFTLAGCAAGLAMAGGVGGLLRGQLHDVDSYDPVAFGVSLALMVVASGMACLIPARRAAAVTPTEALRAE